MNVEQNANGRKRSILCLIPCGFARTRGSKADFGAKREETIPLPEEGRLHLAHSEDDKERTEGIEGARYG